MHGCDSKWIESVPVTETFQGKKVWEGEVQVQLTDRLAVHTRYSPPRVSSTEKTPIIGTGKASQIVALAGRPKKR